MSELRGFAGTVPNVTEEEFRKILAEWEPKAESIQWSEWKDNPLQMPNLKSYKIKVKLKAKPLPTQQEGM